MRKFKKGTIKSIKELIKLPEFVDVFYMQHGTYISHLLFSYEEKIIGLFVGIIGTEVEDNWDLPEFVFSEIEWEIDWSQVETDTKVLVSDDGKKWHKRYFAKTIGEKQLPAVFPEGRTSWTMVEEKGISSEFVSESVEVWAYNKLYEEDK